MSAVGADHAAIVAVRRAWCPPPGRGGAAARGPRRGRRPPPHRRGRECDANVGRPADGAKRGRKPDRWQVRESLGQSRRCMRRAARQAAPIARQLRGRGSRAWPRRGRPSASRATSPARRRQREQVGRQSPDRDGVEVVRQQRCGGDSGGDRDRETLGETENERPDQGEATVRRPYAARRSAAPGSVGAPRPPWSGLPGAVRSRGSP